MLKRLLVGLVLGVVIGGVVAGAVVKGLGVISFTATGGAWGGPALAYLAAIATGVLAGLVAGKPIWAKGAWIEVGLKAFFGSLLAAGAMFALRKWGNVFVNLQGLGSGTLGDLPATSLPIISTVLSIFYELDNTDAPEAEAEAKGAAGASSNKRVAAPKKARVEVASDGTSAASPRRGQHQGEGEEEEQEPKKRMKK
jgi:hypothetical protein